MAKVKAPGGPFARRLEEALTSGLEAGGIAIDDFVIEPVRGTKLHRVLVLARRFEHLTASERQDLVWRIVGGEFTPEEQLRISSILTLTPTEAGGR